MQKLGIIIGEFDNIDNITNTQDILISNDENIIKCDNLENKTDGKILIKHLECLSIINEGLLKIINLYLFKDTIIKNTGQLHIDHIANNGFLLTIENEGILEIHDVNMLFIKNNGSLILNNKVRYNTIIENHYSYLHNKTKRTIYLLSIINEGNIYINNFDIEHLHIINNKNIELERINIIHLILNNWGNIVFNFYDSNCKHKMQKNPECSYYQYANFEYEEFNNFGLIIFLDFIIFNITNNFNNEGTIESKTIILVNKYGINKIIGKIKPITNHNKIELKMPIYLFPSYRFVNLTNVLKNVLLCNKIENRIIYIKEDQEDQYNSYKLKNKTLIIRHNYKNTIDIKKVIDDIYICSSLKEHIDIIENIQINLYMDKIQSNDYIIIDNFIKYANQNHINVKLFTFNRD